MRKILSIFAAMLVALAVNAQGTDFAAPGYSCAADDAVLSGGTSSNFFLKTDVDPHCVAWSDCPLTGNALATWTVTATRGCYVTISLDLGPVISSNKHNFEVTIKDSKSNVKGKVVEGGENTDSEQVKALTGTILLPVAGDYTVELFNNRDWGKGSIKNVIITYDSDAPSSLVDVESVTLNKTTLPLEVEEVEQLTATVLPDDATDPSVTWSSDNESVATVSETGLVTAVAIGTANITAQAGEKSDVCAVTISAVTVPEVSFATPFALTAKKALLNGKVWKMFKDDTYKLYGDGGSNKFYGTATWTIHVTKGCVVSGVLNGVEGGHLFELDLFADTDSLTTIAHPADKKWSEGEIALDGTLTFPAAGDYTLRLRNVQEWSSGKVESITLTWVEDLPVAKDWCGASLYHFFDAGASTDSYVKLFATVTDDNKLVLKLTPDAEKNNKKLDYMLVNPGGYVAGADVAEGGVDELSVAIPIPDAATSVSGIEILWSNPGFDGRWMVQNLTFDLANDIFCMYVPDPVAVPADFEIDLRGGQLGQSGENLKKWLVVGDPYAFEDAAPAEYNAILEAVRFNGAQHGYESLKVTVPVEAGKYKVTLGGCQYQSESKKMAYVKNADETETLGSADQKAPGCYDQNTTTNVAKIKFTVDAPQNVVIVCGQYTPYIKVEKLLVDNLIVTFAKAGDEEGVAPKAIEVEAGQAITIPANRTLYKEGHTLAAWTDGGSQFAPGTNFQPNDDVTLTPIFSANETALLESPVEVNVTWNFGHYYGAPDFKFEGNTGFLVAQTTVVGVTQDVKLDIDATSGKFSNEGRGENDLYAQINTGTILKFPAKAVDYCQVNIQSYSISANSDLDGNALYNNPPAGSEGFYGEYFLPNPTEGVSTFTNAENNYFSYLKLRIPASAVTLSVAETYDLIDAINPMMESVNITIDGYVTQIDQAYEEGSYMNLWVDDTADGIAKLQLFSAYPKAGDEGAKALKVGDKIRAVGSVISKEGENHQLWFANVELLEATGMDNINSVKVTKTVENGQLIIIKNGVKYNAQGAVVR